MSFMSYSKSQEILNALDVTNSRVESIFLNDSQGRILAEDIVASNNYPEAVTASMDGYAIKFSDQDSGVIKVLGDNPAGSENSEEVTNGTCIKTFTGSIMPIGADTLINIENVTFKDNKITIDEKVPLGFATRPIAESYSKDDTLITKGVKITFAEIGVMAGLNKVMVSVSLQPRVSILSTGSELLDLGVEQTRSSQIRSSNSYTLQALATQSGAKAVQMGCVKDDKASIKEAFENALECSDIVVSTGGVSVGDYDFVKDIIPALGAEVIYKGVNIKPGQHILLAKYGKKFIVALPGFAYSSTVTFILYVIPLIRKFLNFDQQSVIVEATLKETFNKRSKKSEFTTCNLSFEDGSYYVDFSQKKNGSSAILTNMLGKQTALLLTGESDGTLEKDTLVNVMKLEF
ncbi:MAG: molybdopterin molybdenumtransferase MoeA [Helicobacteraceae bacterium]|nr:molybdopterin molybdenumtransferase MoeA [Helicobacteraceae bacterium]